MSSKRILARLKSLSDPRAAAGMARFGITGKKMYGVPIPQLRKIARETGTDPSLARRLWSSGVHEARLLATMIDDPRGVTGKQMEEWVKDFDSWDICDQCCGNLFDKTALAHQKAVQWSKRKKEFTRRAGFALMATLAVHDKKAKDAKFLKFFPHIKRESNDERKLVKKAINWALRQIGKRNLNLNRQALRVARQIKKLDSKAAKWIASDALRELESESVQKRLRK